MSDKPIIGVVGLGAMGLGIAQLCAQGGHEVIATDSYAPSRETARARLAEALAPRVAAGKVKQEEVDLVQQRLTISGDLSALAPAEMVIEAIVEKRDAKQHLFAALESIVAAECVLATNTSSLSVTAIMSGLHNKSRALGLHFFNPVPVMKLVELVATPATSPHALAKARSVAEGVGKAVIACADTPGFIVNRCARPYYGEALAMLEDGRSPFDIDAAMMQAGYKLGPFSLIDLIGADINLAATESLSAAMGHHPRYHVFDALKAQVARGDLGRKTGKGFIYPHTTGAPPADAEQIALRIEAVLANEAASLVAVGGVSTKDVDTAMKLGLNFPRGPFEAMQKYGKAKVIEQLSALEAEAPSLLKGRYELQFSAAN